MSLVKRITIGALIVGGSCLVPLGNVMAQGNTERTTSDGWVAKGQWQQRVLQGRPTSRSGPEQARVDQKRIVRWSPSRQGQQSESRQSQSPQNQIRTASRLVQAGREEIPLGEEEQISPDQMSADEAYDSMDMGTSEMFVPGPGYGGCAPGDGCEGGCDDGCGCACGGGCVGCGLGLLGLRSAWWARDMYLFSGAHGFKGPFDRGRNGNFGLHGGVNFGAPLGGPWGWGYQVGFAAAKSNFAGDQVNGPVRRGDRDQYFVTAGIFHRALSGGIQWGVAIDVLRDTYYAKGDMKQIRHEIGYVFRNGPGEIGYMGTYGVGDDEVALSGTSLSLEPTDMFTGYYRRRFQHGGEGRFWAGFTGSGDGLLGADLLVPLGRSWAIQNSFNYLIPRQGRGANGQDEESWGLSIRLVRYMGQTARRGQQSPYRPLLNVADNSLFMFDTVSR